MKNTPVSAYDEQLIKKPRCDGPKINILDIQTITASPLQKKAVTFKSNKNTLFRKQSTGNIKPILKQNKQSSEEKSTHIQIESMQMETNNDIKKTNQMENCEPKCSAEFKKRPLSNVDTSAFSFATKLQTVGADNETKKDNAGKGTIAVSAAILNLNQRMQHTILPFQNLQKTEMVDSHLNKRNSVHHLEVSKYNMHHYTD